MTLTPDAMKLLSVLTLTVGVFVGIVALRRHSRAADNRFDLTDLLLGADGRASKSAFVMYVALAVTTWALVYVVLNRPDLITALFVSYCGIWATPAVTALVVNGFKAPDPPVPEKPE